MRIGLEPTNWMLKALASLRTMPCSTAIR
jgi:hypothetical protein